VLHRGRERAGVGRRRSQERGEDVRGGPPLAEPAQQARRREGGLARARVLGAGDAVVLGGLARRAALLECALGAAASACGASAITSTARPWPKSSSLSMPKAPGACGQAATASRKSGSAAAARPGRASSSSAAWSKRDAREGPSPASAAQAVSAAIASSLRPSRTSKRARPACAGSCRGSRASASR
jgi:hypothetical protein